MSIQRCKLTVVFLTLVSIGVVVLTPGTLATDSDPLNEQLSAVLNQHGFTGRVGLSLEQRLGRKIDTKLAELGRLAFHDSLLGLNDDNSCSGCHSAPLGFGDSQSIAIGVENNNIVGPERTGPRNPRPHRRKGSQVTMTNGSLWQKACPFGRREQRSGYRIPRVCSQSTIQESPLSVRRFMTSFVICPECSLQHFSVVRQGGTS